MANAAAKKAAAGKVEVIVPASFFPFACFVLCTHFRYSFNTCIARKSALSTYLPIVVALNLFYLLLFVVYKWHLSVFQCLMAVILVGLSFISYRGIVDNHATHNSKSDALAGGAFLDMLGLVSFVQFSSFFSHHFYWLLLAIPLQAGWKLYSTMKSAIPGQSTGATTSSSENDQSSEKADEKRQKRAERRRRKW